MVVTPTIIQLAVHHCCHVSDKQRAKANCYMHQPVVACTIATLVGRSCVENY